MSSVSESAVERRVRAWLDSFVVGLNLCPFARPVVASESLRISICDANQLQTVAQRFLTELDLISQSPESEIATTLLVIPNALADFNEYLSFIENAEALIEEQGVADVIQLASFHPHYQFEGEQANSASHFTNRSPYPIIHFLREEMMTKLLADFPHPEQIPQRNIKTLQTIGRAQIEQQWNELW